MKTNLLICMITTSVKCMNLNIFLILWIFAGFPVLLYQGEHCIIDQIKLIPRVL